MAFTPTINPSLSLVQVKRTKQDGGIGYVPADNALSDSIPLLTFTQLQEDTCHRYGVRGLRKLRPKKLVPHVPLYTLLVACVIHTA